MICNSVTITSYWLGASNCYMIVLGQRLTMQNFCLKFDHLLHVVCTTLGLSDS